MTISNSSAQIPPPEMYPKVKVRVQKEEDDQYVYEKSSLESLKAFDWLSQNHFSSPDEAPGSVARIPRSYVPKSPIRNFLASKEETNKPKKTVVEESPKNVRATSAPRPRPRAVLSSPGNSYNLTLTLCLHPDFFV
ncbi:hypothetical protein BUALT_Bualt14G0051200 [Buddleja alternifolia]|uniref:Uncharacterized protein n=1 Tax=Buddleja alternifolia TaxID=168488 RepID=A0AAV6WPN8_9LAMI|nr:hypothetical protein BUALT_Bualt14G0051200 [Buddleja alternifolia]